MKLGLQLGYWGAQPPEGVGELVAAAEDAGFDAIFTAEAWGSDAFTPLAWWGRDTSRVRLGHLDRADVRPFADLHRDARADPRPPDRWPGGAGHGRERPAGRRGLVRPAVRQAAGPHPRGRRHRPQGAGPRGAGHQRRAALPAAVRRRGLDRTRQAAEADRAPVAGRHPDLAGRRGSEERRADGRDRRRLDPDLLHAEDGRDVPALARRGLRARRVPVVRATDFEIAATCHLQITSSDEERQGVIEALKPTIALYMGGMGAKEQNFHKNVFERMGYAEITDEVQELFLAGKRERGHRADPRRARRGHAHRRRRGLRQGAGRGVGGDRGDHAAAQPPLGRRGPADRGGRWADRCWPISERRRRTRSGRRVPPAAPPCWSARCRGRPRAARRRSLRRWPRPWRAGSRRRRRPPRRASAP